MRIDEIRIFPCFAAHPPKLEKMEHKNQYYQTHSSFESEIILDGAGNLINGYTSYLLVGKVHPGDTITVQTARGFRRVTIS